MSLEGTRGQEPERSGEGRRSVLMVDDEPEIVSVLSAHDGEHAFELYRSERPRIVVADIKMPGMNGLELLKRVKGLDGERVMSSKADTRRTTVTAMLSQTLRRFSD